MSKGVRKEISMEECKAAICSPTKVVMKYEPKNFVMGEGAVEERARRFHSNYQGTTFLI